MYIFYYSFKMFGKRSKLISCILILVILAQVSYKVEATKVNKLWKQKTFWTKLTNFERILFLYNLYFIEFSKKNPDKKFQEIVLKAIDIMIKDNRKIVRLEPSEWYIREG